MTRQQKILVALGYLLAATVLVIAVRIEWLNFEAGGILPRREYRNGDPAEGKVKWRASHVRDEAAWRRMHIRDDLGRSTDRELTTDERAAMADDLRRNAARDQLRGFVQTAGVAQYPLAAVLAVISVIMVSQLPKRQYLPVILVAVAASALMWHREYFSSLG